MAGPTLAAVVDAARIGLLDVAEAASGLARQVGRPAIETSDDQSAIDAGDVVLAVGVSARSAAAVRLVEAAGAAQAAAVAFRDTPPIPSSLTQAARAADVVLLRVPAEVSWDQVYAVLEAAIATAWATDSTDLDEANGDLFALANAVAAMVGGPVTIEDVDWSVLAHSADAEPVDEARQETILSRRTPDRWRRQFDETGVYRHLRTSDEVVRTEPVEEEGLKPRLAVAIRAGSEMLGSIWVVEGSRPLGPASENALLEASRIAAGHLARRRATSDADRQVRGELLRSLFDGRGSADHVAARLGLEPAVPVTVLAFRPRRASTQAQMTIRQRLLELVSLHCETLHRDAPCVVVGETTYALLPPDEISGSSVRDLACEVVDRSLRGLGVETMAAIGTTVPSIAFASRSRAAADQILAVLASRDGVHVASVEDVRPSMVLARLREELGQDRTPRFEHLEQIRDHDRLNDADYLPTLRAWLQTFGNVSEAAEQLGVHANTVRYRIKRLEETFDLALADPDERLAADLHLHLWPRPEGG